MSSLSPFLALFGFMTCPLEARAEYQSGKSLQYLLKPPCRTLVGPFDLGPPLAHFLPAPSFLNRTSFLVTTILVVQYLPLSTL